jgi:hypothetical protein
MTAVETTNVPKKRTRKAAAKAANVEPAQEGGMQNG